MTSHGNEQDRTCSWLPALAQTTSLLPYPSIAGEAAHSSVRTEMVLAWEVDLGEQ